MAQSTEGKAEFRRVLDPERLCCYCSQPATMSAVVDLTDDMPGVTQDDLIADIVARRPMRKPSRGAIRVVLDSCDEHDDAVWWAAEESGLPLSAAREVLTESTCPDPWHTDQDAYEATKTPMRPAGGGWHESHFECPTCDASSAGTTQTSPDVVNDPAYKFVAATLGRIAAE